MGERTDERAEEADVESALADLEAELDADHDADAGGSEDEVGFSEEELGVDVAALTADPGERAASHTGDERATDDRGAGPDAAGSHGPTLRERLVPSISVPSPLAALPSARSFALAFLAVVVAMAVVGSVPLLGALSGALGGVVGIFVGAFVLGLASGQRRYLPVAVAGATAAGVTAALDLFRVAVLAGVGLAPFAVLGAGAGLLAAVAGHYFGRDLRAGLVGDLGAAGGEKRD